MVYFANEVNLPVKVILYHNVYYFNPHCEKQANYTAIPV